MHFWNSKCSKSINNDPIYMKKIFWMSLGVQDCLTKKIMIISQLFFSKKFYSGGGPRVEKVCNFLEISRLYYVLLPLKRVSKLKNHHQLTFVFLKSVWSVVRCSRLFLWIDMSLMKPTNTHNRYSWPTENFFMPLELKCHVH